MVSLTVTAARADVDFMAELYANAVETSVTEEEMANIDVDGTHIVMPFYSTRIDYENDVQVIAVIQYVARLRRGIAYFRVPTWMFTGMETTELDTIAERIQELTWSA